MNVSELYFLSVGKTLEPNNELEEALPTQIRDVPYAKRLNRLSKFFVESSEKLAISNLYVSCEIDSASDKFFWFLPTHEELAYSDTDFNNLVFSKTLFGRASLASNISSESESMTLTLSDARFNTDGEYSLFRDLSSVLFSHVETGAQFRCWDATKVSDVQVEVSLRPPLWSPGESVEAGFEFAYGGSQNQLFRAMNSGTFGTAPPSVSSSDTFFDGDVEVEYVGVAPALLAEISAGDEIALSPETSLVEMSRRQVSSTVTSDSGRFNASLVGLTPASPFSGSLDIHFLTGSMYSAIFSDSLVYYGSRLRLFRPIDTRLSAPLISIPSSAFTGVFVEGDLIEFRYVPSKICVAYGTLSEESSDSGTFSIYVNG